MKNKILGFITFILFFISLILIFTTFFTDRYFGQIGISQVIINLTQPIVGIDKDFKLQMFKSICQYSTCIFVICIIVYFPKTVFRIFTFLLNKMPTFISFFISKFFKFITATRFFKFIAVTKLFFIILIFFIFTLGYIENKYKIYETIQYNKIQSSYLEENYSLNILEITWKKKNNFVLIIVESLEDTFSNEALFNPPLTPKLTALQNSNLTFSKHLVTPFSEWTIAGITHYLLGIPLKLPRFIGRNDFGKNFNRFLPKATSITKVMEEAGYNINFTLGWDATFSGYRKLITDHSNDLGFDEEYFLNKGYVLNDHTRGKWGFSDFFVFKKSIEIFKNNISQDAPFGLIVNTVDTHVPVTKNDYKMLDDSLSNFVEEILEVDSETTIIIIGDHLLMSETVEKIILTDRMIYNCFINSAKSPLQNPQSRVFGGVDIAPTILEAIGAEIPNGKFALGVSLFSSQPTLLEQNQKMYFEEILKESLLYDSFY